MLKTQGKKIVDNKGRTIVLKSIGIGGWLMMEGYMLGGRNIPEHKFKEDMAGLYGKKGLKDFEGKFRSSFFNEADVKRIRSLGFNCARLPINYRCLIDDKGRALLKKAVSWFKKHKVYVVLDLHAAPGSQNEDWHSDSSGDALMWKDDRYIEITAKLWGLLAQTFKNEEYVAGYDILNEPVTIKLNKLNLLYSKIIRAIRNSGDKHIIFVEPNMWAQKFDGIKVPKDNNFAWSIHFYIPINFTFNWNPLLRVPSREYIKKELLQYKDIQDRDNVPVFVGEFGVSSRCPNCHEELKWVERTISTFKEFGWSWSYWTYKSVAGMLVPDGLYRTFDHEMFHRETSTPGMENILKVFGTAKKRLFKALGTKSFSLHDRLYKTIKKFLLVLLLIGGIAMASQAKTIDWNIKGCYTGAFIDWKTFDDGQPYITTEKDISAYQEQAGSHCAIIALYKAFQFDDQPYDFPFDAFERAVNNGSILLLTWEPRDWDQTTDKYFKRSILPDIISGKYDKYIDSWAAAIKDLPGPILLRFAPEMNLNNLSWSGTQNGGQNGGPETYKKAYRYIHDRFAKKEVNNVSWVWTPINWGMPFETWNHYSNYYPGDKYVDVVGLDEYNWGNSQPWSHWQKFDEIYWKFYSEVSNLYPTKPLMISEFGCAENGGNKGEWLKNTFASIKKGYPRIKAFIWFNKDNSEGLVNNMEEHANWALSSSPDASNAMKDTMKDPYYIDKISYIK